MRFMYFPPRCPTTPFIWKNSFPEVFAESFRSVGWHLVNDGIGEETSKTGNICFRSTWDQHKLDLGIFHWSWDVCPELEQTLTHCKASGHHVLWVCHELRVIQGERGAELRARNRELMLKYADWIVVLNQNDYDTVTAFRDNVMLLPHFTPNVFVGDYPELLLNNNANARAFGPYHVTPKTFCYYGTLRPHKGVLALADAWNEVKEQYPEWTFKIYAYPDASALGSELNKRVGDRTVWVPGYDLLADHLGEFAVLPYTECNNSGVVEELIACECPTVSTDVAAFVGKSLYRSNDLRHLIQYGIEHVEELRGRVKEQKIQQIKKTAEVRCQLVSLATEVLLSRYTREYRLAVVLQRFGDVVGGAELHAKLVIEHLRASLGCPIDIITTTARDHLTWENSYPEGVTEVGLGIRLFRYNSDTTTTPWLSHVGPTNSKISQHLTDNYYDAVIFFYVQLKSTLDNAALVPGRALLVPLVHDDFPTIVTPEMTAMLRSIRAILVNSAPEAKTLVTSCPFAVAKVSVVGMGFDEHLVTLDGKRTRGNYFLYLGRISTPKGGGELIDRFLAFNKKHPGYQLFLAGTVEPDVTLPDDPCVQYLGYVSDREKRELMLGALAIVNLSEYESLSMLALEAMMLGTPLIVNSGCRVLREYAQTLPTVYGTHDEESFIESARTVASEDWASEGNVEKLSQTQSWATKLYNWETVVAKYKKALKC